MKKRYIFLSALLALGISYDVLADARVRTASPAVYADVELPFRCTVDETNKNISSTISLSPDDFSFVRLDKGDELPRYAVNGYTFSDKSTNEALGELLKQADIKVLAPTIEHTWLDGKDVKGELATVVEQLANAGDMFYTYSSATKTLTLTPRAEFALNVPKNKIVLMALLDAVRGAGIHKHEVNWEKYQIRMDVTVAELKKAKQIVNRIMDDSYLLSAEIMGYEIVPHNPVNEWQTVFNNAADMVAMVNRAAVGRTVVLKRKVFINDFLDKVSQTYAIYPIAGGQAIVPNGWQMKFNLQECTMNVLPYPQMQVVMKTKIQNESDERTQFTLNALTGTITTFDVSSALNQEVLFVGIPTRQGNSELMFAVKFNLIRFVKQGE